MRTTIVIDDALFRQLRQRAAELNTTMSAVIETALRGELATRPRAKRKPFKLRVNKGPGLVAGQTWDRVARNVLDGDSNGIP